MKTGAGHFYLAAAAMVLIAVVSHHAQQAPVGRTKDFTSEMYFDPPNEMQVKMRLSGSDAVPLTGGLLEVKNLKIEMFETNGQTQIIVQAPQCIYAPLDSEASSPGRLEVQTGDGRIQFKGEGFLWRQNKQSLIISNKVQTVADISSANRAAKKVP